LVPTTWGAFSTRWYIIWQIYLCSFLAAVSFFYGVSSQAMVQRQRERVQFNLHPQQSPNRCHKTKGLYNNACCTYKPLTLEHWSTYVLKRLTIHTVLYCTLHHRHSALVIERGNMYSLVSQGTSWVNILASSQNNILAVPLLWEEPEYIKPIPICVGAMYGRVVSTARDTFTLSTERERVCTVRVQTINSWQFKIFKDQYYKNMTWLFINFFAINLQIYIYMYT